LASNCFPAPVLLLDFRLKIMASLFIQLRPEVKVTRNLRIDTHHTDGDIKRDPGILIERAKYEAREHVKKNDN